MSESGNIWNLRLNESGSDFDEVVNEMCERLLANTVIEDYRYEVEEVVTQ